MEIIHMGAAPGATIVAELVAAGEVLAVVSTVADDKGRWAFHEDTTQPPGPSNSELMNQAQAQAMFGQAGTYWQITEPGVAGGPPTLWNVLVTGPAGQVATVSSLPAATPGSVTNPDQSSTGEQSGTSGQGFTQVLVLTLSAPITLTASDSHVNITAADLSVSGQIGTDLSLVDGGDYAQINSAAGGNFMIQSFIEIASVALDSGSTALRAVALSVDAGGPGYYPGIDATLPLGVGNVFDTRTAPVGGVTAGSEVADLGFGCLTPHNFTGTDTCQVVGFTLAIWNV